MRIIKTQQDLVVLRLAVTLPVELLLQVEEYLLQLRDEQKEEEATEFRLVGRGYIQSRPMIWIDLWYVQLYCHNG
ncbi:hypothetical protein [Paenibacillus elgii]|uniref:hypothetical protein n=1 Tax=Paenibacillus elgii TaxID=189691 RepID=UPI00203C5D85|nr:hypothetical protein [Paenibacillus elgii]MCM3271692.1 hypothetical protein [Paenibacillus elgii]